MNNNNLLGEVDDENGDNGGLRQEKSLEQQLKMERLEVNALAECDSPNNKSLTGGH